MKLGLFCLAAVFAVPCIAYAQDNAMPDAATATTQTNGVVATTTTAPTDRTISWYMANTDARKARIKVCDNDPGHLANDPDCINAKKADNQAGVNDFKGGVDNTIQNAADFFHKF